MNALQKMLGAVVIVMLLIVAAPGQAAEANEAVLDGAGQGQAVIVTINALPSGFIGTAPPVEVQLWQVGGRSTIVRGLKYREAKAVVVNAAYSRALVKAGRFPLIPTRPQRLMANQQYCLVVMDHRPLMVPVGPAKPTLEQAERDFRCWKLLHRYSVYGLL